MRNRKNSSFALLAFLLVVITMFWLMRTQFHSKGSSRLSESGETHVGPADIYPDPVRTPGATNPGITLDNIRETICDPSWSTKSIRPPASYTNRLKVEQILEYGYSDSTVKDYEEDHFIPLELGGNPTDPRNLWPESFDTSISDGGSAFQGQSGELSSHEGLRGQPHAGTSAKRNYGILVPRLYDGGPALTGWPSMPSGSFPTITITVRSYSGRNCDPGCRQL